MQSNLDCMQFNSPVLLQYISFYEKYFSANDSQDKMKLFSVNEIFCNIDKLYFISINEK